MSRSAVRKDDVIQIRAPREAKALIQRAAALKHQKLSEFMLESAQRSAEAAILDATLFQLGEEDYAAFVALLDAPPAPSAKVKARYARPAPWSA